MPSFFKKALSTFVEFDEKTPANNGSVTTPFILHPPASRSTPYSSQPDHAEAEKFEKYFDDLFNNANLPGPDYFEFHKMMETLEVHIKDENDRISATFASLKIQGQGLTKETLVDTANQYKAIIEKDKSEFEKALNEKLKSDVGDRKNKLDALEKTVRANAEEIQRLLKENADAQIQMETLKTEAADIENKLTKNSEGYRIASQSLINKISADIQKIQSTL